MKTVKVSIPVAVDCYGNWAANGCNNQIMEVSEQDVLQVIGEGLVSLYYIEAELEIPETKTVQGGVTKK